MRVLYYDCFSGISGDMNLAAMIDIGVDRDYLIGELAKLNINREFEIKVSRAIRKGIEGTKVDVILKDNEKQITEPHDGHHNHEEVHHEGHHSHGNLEHHHNHDNSTHSHDHGSSHEHRNLSSIEQIITSSNLNDNVKKISMDIFIKIAHAEAKIHGKTIHDVHFHEVGAVDSIVDIVGAAICVDYLKVDKIMCSSIELGGGFVRCAHGLIPVPAPATLEILKGMPIKTGAVPVETTTPTGAAILAVLVDESSNLKNFVVDSIGYGVGNRDTVIPNVVRVMIGHF
jgi:pyridinium-3,5-bisthiocarboxylic acid mononucleotide nickel chelatase